MSCDLFAGSQQDYATLAYATLPRLLVFQRLPKASEDQQDARGFPKVSYTDIDAQHPIPCIFTCSSGRETVLEGQQRLVTLYKFTIPGFYKTVDGSNNPIWKVVDFSPAYRVHLLAKDVLPEQFFQITGGGEDVTPAIQFPAVRLENTV